MEKTNNNYGAIGSLNLLVSTPNNKFNVIDSDEECNEDDEEIITICRCCKCNKLKFIENIVCIEIQPDKIWKCCDCIAIEVQIETEEEDEMQPHCYICFNMNMNLNVNCFNCNKIYCKSHSYCILGDDDMPYCSKECFINC
jgi:hypothetical protein